MILAGKAVAEGLRFKVQRRKVKGMQNKNVTRKDRDDNDRIAVNTGN